MEAASFRRNAKTEDVIDRWSHVIRRLTRGTVRTRPVATPSLSLNSLFMQHKDVVAEAITDSGKKLAFVTRVLEKPIRRERRPGPNQIGALIISTTKSAPATASKVFTGSNTSPSVTQRAGNTGTLHHPAQPARAVQPSRARTIIRTLSFPLMAPPQKTSRDSYSRAPISSLALRVGSRNSCWTKGRILLTTIPPRPPTTSRADEAPTSLAPFHAIPPAPAVLLPGDSISLTLMCTAIRSAFRLAYVAGQHELGNLDVRLCCGNRKRLTTYVRLPSHSYASNDADNILYFFGRLCPFVQISRLSGRSH